MAGKKRIWILKIDWRLNRQKKGEEQVRSEATDRLLNHFVKAMHRMPGIQVDRIESYRADPSDVPSVDPAMVEEFGTVWCNKHGCFHDDDTDPYDTGSDECEPHNHRRVFWLALPEDEEYKEQVQTRVWEVEGALR